MVQDTWMVQETMNGTGNLDGSGGDEWYRKAWMVQETVNGTGHLVQYNTVNLKSLKKPCPIKSLDDSVNLKSLKKPCPIKSLDDSVNLKRDKRHRMVRKLCLSWKPLLKNSSENN